MRETESAVFANMCMVCDGDRVLVEDRVDKDWPGITFPGGHVEPEESFVRSAIREVREETGLDVWNLRLCGVKQWTDRERGLRYVVFLYRTDCFRGELRASDEGEVFWIDRAELPARRLASGFAEMLEVFERDGVTENYYWYENGWKQENL